MVYLFERRKSWNRLIGLERRGAPFRTLLGRPLPDPTLLIDEDFLTEEARREEERSLFLRRTPWKPGRPRK